MAVLLRDALVLSPYEARRRTRLVRELVELVRTAMASEKLPVSGGERAQVSVTIPFTALETGFGTGRASWSGPLLRTLACDAQLIPIVLGSDGVPLDVGRSRRTAPPSVGRAGPGVRVPGM
ncbi:DUF222 domain-containing protein [Allokutzneria albata]|uniref:DUF222 domain-containing protein n=1 Tax=Allokutzneria albata TaxID=211114 RepID=UPI0004C3F861|nr:DUF222 domain-containing protein [Allokutzneria albata]